MIPGQDLKSGAVGVWAYSLMGIPVNPSVRIAALI